TRRARSRRAATLSPRAKFRETGRRARVRNGGVPRVRAAADAEGAAAGVRRSAAAELVGRRSSVDAGERADPAAGADDRARAGLRSARNCARVRAMDVAQIRHVAKLAELSLSPDEERTMAEEIGKIVAYVEELSAIDTTDVPPTAHVGVGGGQDAWRADVPCEGLSHEDALREAPHAE